MMKQRTFFAFFNFSCLILTICVGSVENREVTFEMFKGKVVRIDKFMITCPEIRNHPFSVYYDNVTGSGLVGKMTIDYDIVNKNLIKAPMILIVDIQRCQSKENPDSCLKFATFKTSRLCNLLETDKEFWSPMVTCATPKLGCPMAKGIYRGRNCTLDMSRYNWFPMGDSYWKLKVQIANERNVKLGCSLVEGKLFTRKN